MEFEVMDYWINVTQSSALRGANQKLAYESPPLQQPIDPIIH